MRVNSEKPTNGPILALTPATELTDPKATTALHRLAADATALTDELFNK